MLPAELRTFAEAHLGDLQGIRFWGHPHAESRVWELVGAQRAFLKVLRQQGKFKQELHAYRTWLPQLEHVPKLIATDEIRQVLLLSALPGATLERAPLTPSERLDVYVRAGTFLRALHGLPVTGTSDLAPLVEAYRQRAQSWLARAEGVVERRICDWVSGQVAEVTETFGALSARSVPCHLDYTGRNWLVTTTGGRIGLSVIDFEHSRRDYWLSDIEKLNLDGWEAELEAAFWQGYGKRPSAEEASFADKLAAFAAFRVIVWAREHGDGPFEAKGWHRLQSLGARPGSKLRA